MILETTVENDGTLRLILSGATLDRALAPKFREDAAKAILETHGTVEIDCTPLEFIDSSGVGALLHAHNTLTPERRPIRLTGVGRNVVTILELMQVHRVFDVQPK
jgi:anti-sigma B factor antagonist